MAEKTEAPAGQGEGDQASETVQVSTRNDTISPPQAQGPEAPLNLEPAPSPGGADVDGGRPETSSTDVSKAYRSAQVGRRLSTQPHSTDLGNAHRLVAMFGHLLRYCPQHCAWLYWNEQRWRRDELGQINQFAKSIVRDMYLRAFRQENEEAREKLVRWALQSEYVGRIAAMIELAKTEPGIPVAPRELDREPMLLGVENGVVELHTGELRPAKREDLITKQAGVAFDPNAECPKWTEFLQTIFDGDKDLIAYHQRLVGYCLTGLTSEQFLFIPWGQGANGKSVLWETIKALLGDYAATTPPEMLMKRRNPGGPSPDLARLQGVRLSLACEPEEGSLLAESIVKRITGQDTIACRELYGKIFEYQPQFKTVLITNHKPIIRGDDHAIWRRIQLIPHPVTIPPEMQDKSLFKKLRAELPGILNWALKGLRAYLKDGLAPPSCVDEAVREYRSEMDILGDWIADCAIEEPDCRTLVRDLYRSYQGWCKESGHHPFSKKRFSQKLDERGFERSKTGEGRNFIGLRLIAETVKLPIALVKSDDTR